MSVLPMKDSNNAILNAYIFAHIIIWLTSKLLLNI